VSVPEQIALGFILDCVTSASGFLGDLRRPTTPTETVRNGGILFLPKAVLSGTKNGPQSAPSSLDSQRPLRSEWVRQQAIEPFGDAVETQPDIARYTTERLLSSIVRSSRTRASWHRRPPLVRQWPCAIRHSVRFNSPSRLRSESTCSSIANWGSRPRLPTSQSRAPLRLVWRSRWGHVVVEHTLLAGVVLPAADPGGVLFQSLVGPGRSADVADLVPSCVTGQTRT
jgi:hypothetical protein